jgi:ABC-type transporter Mla maintaining outer membrane lipid asymmetry ATPase subunit MlaF
LTSNGTPVVALEHVSLAFDDEVVLRDVSFSVAPGDMAILFGASAPRMPSS